MRKGKTLRRFEQLHRWRMAAAWAPMFWMPVVIYGISTQRLALGMSLGLAGFAFALVARAAVWLRRCPECGEHFGATPEEFETIWEDSGCRACGVSLFRLRRAAR